MNKCIKFVLCLCLGVVTALGHASQFEETVFSLSEGSYSQKAKVIEALADIQDERVLPVLKALIEPGFGVFLDETTSQLLIVEKKNDALIASNVISGGDVVVTEETPLKKVKVNNRLRRLARAKIAVIQLQSPDSSVRYESAKNLSKKPDKNLRDVIAEAHIAEKTSKVKRTLALALAFIDIHSSDQTLRFNAVEVLGTSVEPKAVGVLTRLAEKNDQGEYLDDDPIVAELAEKKLKSVQSKVSFFKFSENALYGISLGSILLLAAIGLAITFGVMGVINMAHGEMIMLGAYTTFFIQLLFPSLVDWSLLIAIPTAFLVSGCAGVLIERLVIRHLYGRPLDTLLATFGISLILQQAVRTYRSNNVPVVTPDWLSGFWSANGAMSITYNRIYILIFSLIVLAMLALILKKTMMGLQMRAVTQNRPMANSMGIRSGWVDALTFGLGSGIAGIAGVALSQITNVGPNMGQAYIIDSFMVVVFGGVGNLLGTFFGAMSLGLANKFLEPYSGAVVGKIIVLVFIILFIQWRPRGLFALKGRFVDD